MPSFARWRAMSRVAPGQSILRALQYEKFSSLKISGRVLDFGGGRRASYIRWLKDADVVSVNIDAQFDPTHIVEPGTSLPFHEGEFDAVVTLNTLEHVYDDIAALRELSRVTRPGGALHIMVPFLFRVHGHPDDFNRHTPSWWARALEEAGYAQARLVPLIFGRRTAAQLVAGRGGRAIRGLTGGIAASIDILSARLSFPAQDSYIGRKGEKVWSQSPGWYIHAVR
ncbi:MAG: class I SAM-dependent methyltransferase [Pseudomonadota bacterium]